MARWSCNIIAFVKSGRVVFNAVTFALDGEGVAIDWGLYASLDGALIALRDSLLAEVWDDTDLNETWTASWGEKLDWDATRKWLAVADVRDAIEELRQWLEMRAVVIERTIRADVDSAIPTEPQFPERDGAHERRSLFEEWRWNLVYGK